MEYEIHYLSRDNDGYREMDNRMALDDHVPEPEEIDDLWEMQVDGNLDADDPEAALSALWNAYNRGPGGYIAEMDEKEMRSMSVNDIVVLDGQAYLCASAGWEEIEMGDA